MFTHAGTSSSLTALLQMIHEVTDGGHITRNDLANLASGLRDFLAAEPDSAAHSLLLTVVNTLPYALREANGEVQVDVPAIAGRLVQEYNAQQSGGFYLVANVGAGYLLQPESGAHALLSPMLFEQIGVGFRFNRDSIRHGIHAFVSGLLLRASISGSSQDQIFGGAGYSVSFYELVELSIDGGLALDTTVAGLDPRPFGVLSLQVPLADYVSAAATALEGTGTDVDQAPQPAVVEVHAPASSSAVRP